MHTRTVRRVDGRAESTSLLITLVAAPSNDRVTGTKLGVDGSSQARRGKSNHPLPTSNPVRYRQEPGRGRADRRRTAARVHHRAIVRADRRQSGPDTVGGPGWKPDQRLAREPYPVRLRHCHRTARSAPRSTLSRAHRRDRRTWNAAWYVAGVGPQPMWSPPPPPLASSSTTRSPTPCLNSGGAET